MNLVISEIFNNKHCSGCILNERKDYIFVRNETLKLNAKYARDKITVLLVSEPPPRTYLHGHSSYFYALA
jgi:hypothetical protein